MVEHGTCTKKRRRKHLLSAAFWSIYTRLVVRPLEASCLDVLEVRRSGREAINVEKSRIKDPVSVWRTINVVAAFESPVIVGGVEQIYQRAAIVKPVTAPVFEEPLKVMNTAIHLRVTATLIGSSV